MTTGGNGNVSGNSEDRRRRRAWLVETYRADRDIVGPVGGHDIGWDRSGRLACKPGTGIPACRCYRCGILCTVDELTVDRIIPGALGGTYRRNNIRPACSDCNNKTGGKLGAQQAKKRKKPKGWLSADPVL